VSHTLDDCDLAAIGTALDASGELGAEERARLEAHLAACEVCAEVRAIALPLAPRPRRRAPAIVAIVAASAVAAGAVAAGAVGVARLARPARPDLARVDPSTAASAATASAATAGAATASAGPPSVVAADDLPATASRGAVPTPPSASAATAGAATASAATAGAAIAAPLDPKAIPDAPTPDGRATGGASPPREPDDLSAASVQEVVSRNRAGVRKACWASGAEQRAANLAGVSSVKVRVKMTITPSGKVASAEGATADPRFVDVASCTARQAASWRFPAARGTTSILVPFVFVLERPSP